MKHTATSNSFVPERLSVNSDSDSFQSYSNNVRPGEPEHTSDPSNSYTHDPLMYNNCESHNVDATCLPPQIIVITWTYLLNQKDCIFAI